MEKAKKLKKGSVADENLGRLARRSFPLKGFFSVVSGDFLMIPRRLTRLVGKSCCNWACSVVKSILIKPKWMPTGWSKEDLSKG